MKNKFYEELRLYDINWRTAGSLYDIFKRKHRLMLCSDKEICSAYRKWYAEDSFLCEFHADRVLKVIEIVRAIIDDGRSLPDRTHISTPWGDEYICLCKEVRYKNGDETRSVAIPINSNATYQKLFDAWDRSKHGAIEVGVYVMLCPMCGSHLGTHAPFSCASCHLQLPRKEGISRMRLMSKKEMMEK